MESTGTAGPVATVIVNEPGVVVGMIQVEKSVLDWNTLLGAAVGALLVFVFTEVREYQQRRRERTGLLKLLIAELDHNYQRMSELDGATGREFDRVGGQALPISLEAWVECRTKIAQLVDTKTFSDLENYYRKCQDLKDIGPDTDARRDTNSALRCSEQRQKESSDMIKELQRQAIHTRNRMQKYNRVFPRGYQPRS